MQLLCFTGIHEEMAMAAANITIVVDFMSDHRIHLFSKLTSDVYPFNPLTAETRTRADGTTIETPEITFAPQPLRPTVTRPKCPHVIVNTRDHGVHFKTYHRNDVQTGARHWFTTTRRGKCTSAVIPWDGVGTGRCWRVALDHANIGAGNFLRCRRSEIFVLQPVDNGPGN